MFKFKRLGKDFANQAISCGTLNEPDLLMTYHDFLLANYSGYSEMGEFEDSQDMINQYNELSDNQDSHFPNIPDELRNDISYQVNEVLPNLLESISPEFCHFGASEGSSSDIGYWEIIDTESVIYEFEDYPRLVWSRGYDITHVDSPIGAVLANIDDFLTDKYFDEYHNSDLESIVMELSDCGDYSPRKDTATMLYDFIVNELFPIIAPIGFEYRVNDDDDNGHLGFYQELPKILPMVDDYDHAVEAIHTANAWQKIYFLNENKAMSELAHSGNDHGLEWLTDYCLKVIEEKHFVRLDDAIEEASKFKAIHEYASLPQNYNLLNWLIEKVYYDDFKRLIDRVIGGQDITRLWNKVNEFCENEDTYFMRESCEVCEGIEDITDMSELEIEAWDSCSCCAYEDTNNVWIVSDYSFFACIRNNGGMTLEDYGLCMYFQTTYSGNYNDSILRKAYLDYSNFELRRLLEDNNG